MTFKELGLHEGLLEAISYMNFVEATPIQEQAIPAIMNQKDVLACAQTGTGKTAAFLLPILDELAENPSQHTTTLIVVPTRELAVQIHQEIQGFSYFIGVHSAAVYGGGDGREWDLQKEALTNGTHIIVATPGKLISHLQQGHVKFGNVRHLILDEADRMLDMGFHDDLMKIVSFLPEKRQNLLFSATFPPKIRKMGRELLNEPEEISIAIAKPSEKVEQRIYRVFDEQKSPLLRRIIREHPEYECILVFSSTKKKVNSIIRSLKHKDYRVDGISSDFEQAEREAVLSRFRSRRTRVLVATDVLSRGIDIKDIDLVVNYDVPSDAADYVHRIGRTARAKTEGVAITLVNPADMVRFDEIERLIERTLEKHPAPEDLGESPTWRKPGQGGGGRNRGRNTSRRGGANRSKGSAGGRSGGNKNRNQKSRSSGGRGPRRDGSKGNRSNNSGGSGASSNQG